MAGKQNRLTDDVKRFIVQALACYDTPMQVVEAVKEEFGIVLERPHIQVYDPNRAMGRDLSKKWRDLFDATRKRFLEDSSQIPIANQTFRLKALARIHTEATKRGNHAMAAQVIEQAAKEVGGVFTNRQKLEHTGADGGPMAMFMQQISESKNSRLKIK